MNSYDRLERPQVEKGFKAWVSDLMSDQYATYPWTMPILLLLEGIGLVYLAVWPHWFGIPLAIVAWWGAKWVNEFVAEQVWKTYDRKNHPTFTSPFTCCGETAV